MPAAERHDYYNVDNYPHFICNHGKWDIYANAQGHCAAIPTKSAARCGCRASHFGDLRYVIVTLGLPAAIASFLR